MSKTVIITRGAGFVGSNLAFSLKNKYPEWQVIALDNLKRRGSNLLHGENYDLWSVNTDYDNYQEGSLITKVGLISTK
jgi:nucleoside-diphosphate-sugar epimerase